MSKDDRIDVFMYIKLIIVYFLYSCRDVLFHLPGSVIEESNAIAVHDHIGFHGFQNANFLISKPSRDKMQYTGQLPFSTYTTTTTGDLLNVPGKKLSKKNKKLFSYLPQGRAFKRCKKPCSSSIHSKAMTRRMIHDMKENITMKEMKLSNIQTGCIRELKEMIGLVNTIKILSQREELSEKEHKRLIEQQDLLKCDIAIAELKEVNSSKKMKIDEHIRQCEELMYQIDGLTHRAITEVKNLGFNKLKADSALIPVINSDDSIFIEFIHACPLDGSECNDYCSDYGTCLTDVEDNCPITVFDGHDDNAGSQVTVITEDDGAGITNVEEDCPVTGFEGRDDNDGTLLMDVEDDCPVAGFDIEKLTEDQKWTLKHCRKGRCRNLLLTIMSMGMKEVIMTSQQQKLLERIKLGAFRIIYVANLCKAKDLEKQEVKILEKEIPYLTKVIRITSQKKDQMEKLHHFLCTQRALLNRIDPVFFEERFTSTSVQIAKYRLKLNKYASEIALLDKILTKRKLKLEEITLFVKTVYEHSVRMFRDIESKLEGIHKLWISKLSVKITVIVQSKSIIFTEPYKI